jgi:hypothetical protein
MYWQPSVKLRSNKAMNKERNESELKYLIDDSDRLLEELDGLGSANQKMQITKNASESSPYVRSEKEYPGQDSNQRLHTLAYASCLALGGLVIVAILASQNPKTNTGLASRGDREADARKGRPEQSVTHQPDVKPELTASQSFEEVRFNGIDLPITNRLCNRKRSFCINGLARIVQAESGEADYTFEDIANGELVSIKGKIGISDLKKSADGTREFTFWFRDDHSLTTSGWAAAGFFRLDQDQKQPGILTRFTTTESFGPKTPVGLENKSYLFPS